MARHIVIAAAVAAIGFSASAATFDWAGVSGNISSGASFVGGTAPAAISADTFNFATGPSTATLDLPGLFFNQINLNTTAAGSVIDAAGLLPNQPLLRTFGPSASINHNGADFQIAAPINLTSDLTVNVAATAGVLTLGPTSDSNFVSGPGNLIINNASPNAVLIGNTPGFSGDIRILAGNVTLSRTGGDAVGPLSVIDIAAGSTFDFNANGEEFAGISGDGTIAMGSAGGLTFFSSRNLAFGGAITQPLGGTGNVAKAALSRNSTYTWTGTSTYVGTTTVANGSIILADANGAIANTSSITISGSGVLLLDNTAANNNNRINDAANLVLSATFKLQGAPGIATTETANQVGWGGNGLGRIEVVNGASGGTAVLTLAALAARNNRGQGLEFAGDGKVIFTAAPTLVNGIIPFAIKGADFATVVANEIVPYAAYTPVADINAAVAADNVVITAPLAGPLTANKTINSLKFTSPETLTLNAGTTLQLTAGGILATTDATITGGTLLPINTPGGREIFAVVQGATTRLTLASTIPNTSTVSVQKVGDGILKLEGTNAFSGLRIWGGTVEFTALANLGSATGVIIANGGTLKALATVDLRSAGRQITANGAGLTLDVAAGETLSASNIGGGGGLTKIGAGTLEFNNTNAFDGDFNILAGNVNLVGGITGSFLDDTVTLTIAAGASFNANDNTEDIGGLAGAGTYNTGPTPGVNVRPLGEVNTVFSGILAGAGNLNKDGLHTMTVSGPSTYTGETVVAGGRLIVQGSVLNNTDGPLGNSSSLVTLGAAGGLANATLVLDTPASTFARNINVRAGGVGLAAIEAGFASGSATISGTVDLFRPLEVITPASTSLNFTGTFTQNGGILKTGLGTASVIKLVEQPLFIAQGTFQLADSGTGIEGDVNGTDINGGNGGIVGTGSTTVLTRLVLGGEAGAWVGTLDIRNNDLVVRAAATNIDTVREQVAFAYNGGLWDQPGITSSRAAGDGLAVGYGSNLDLGYTVFSGITTGTDDFLVKYTWFGDANLDGQVDGDDYLLWLAVFGSSGSGIGWGQGDFDYDQDVDGDDYLLWLQNFGNGIGAPLAAVPEPGILGLATVAAAGLLARRRRAAR